MKEKGITVKQLIVKLQALDASGLGDMECWTIESDGWVDPVLDCKVEELDMDDGYDAVIIG